jgi:hypothetical protein
MDEQPHPTAYHCARCEAIGATPAEADAKIRSRDADMLKRFGWLAHIVVDDPDSPTGFNWHTHGLQERYDYRDFQIVCPLPPKVAHQIGNTLADLNFAFKEGKIDVPVKRLVGSGFCRPPKKVLRQAKEAKGKRLFEAEE